MSKKYKVIYSDLAEKKLSKMDDFIVDDILNFIERNLIDTANPRELGKALNGNLKGKWSYRHGNYRIIALIKDKEIEIYIFDIGHRRDVYK